MNLINGRENLRGIQEILATFDTRHRTKTLATFDTRHRTKTSKRKKKEKKNQNPYTTQHNTDLSQTNFIT